MNEPSMIYLFLALIILFLALLMCGCLWLLYDLRMTTTEYLSQLQKLTIPHITDTKLHRNDDFDRNISSLESRLTTAEQNMGRLI